MLMMGLAAGLGMTRQDKAGFNILETVVFI